MEPFTVESLVSSNAARICAGVALLAIVVLVLQIGGKWQLSREQRYLHYLNFFKRRYFQCVREDILAPSNTQLLRDAMRHHSLFRLFFRAEWSPQLPRPSRLRTIAVILALVQATGLVAVAFFLPPIRSALPGIAAVHDLLPTVIAIATCILVQVCLQVTLDGLFRVHSSVVKRWPDALGRTEGHVIARAALAHFDEVHTIRSMLLLWRQNVSEMEQLGALLARLRFHHAVRVWKEGESRAGYHHACSRPSLCGARTRARPHASAQSLISR